jgi:hypothetical protein
LRSKAGSSRSHFLGVEKEATKAYSAKYAEEHSDDDDNDSV